MDRWITKYLLPLLLIALAAALYAEFGAVEKLELDLEFDRASARPQASPQASEFAGPVAGSRLLVGQRYNSLQALVSDQRAAGYVRVGYFGSHWPATVSEIASDRDSISFVRANGTRHNYNKFDGYAMKMVRLKAGAKETIVVFRSAEKR